MNTAIFLVQALNLLFIGALPKVFFKRGGRLNMMWWLTALPFGVAGVLLVMSLVGLVSPRFAFDGLVGSGLGLAGVTLSVASIALIAFTLGTHQRRIALWHQAHDAPEHIVTHGAYKYVRHPFYAAFLLGLLGIVLHIPHIISVVVFIYAALILAYTARREEYRLCHSAFSEQYRSYKQTTGRFVPKWSTHHA